MEITEIIQLIKDNQKVPSWIDYARENNNELKALVYGENFHDLLINRIEHIEESKRAEARLKYSIDIRDLFYRVFAKRENVFSADGSEEHFNDIVDKRKDNIKAVLKSFKNKQSIEQYLSKNLFQLSDVDPNGLIMMEYKEVNGELKTYPTYKSIQDIRLYEPNGLFVDYILFEPIKFEKHKEWRFVDAEIDTIIKETNGLFEQDLERTYKNALNEVPAVILSDIEKVGTNIRLSWLFYIKEITKKYARDLSVKTIYEFLQGFTKHWRYVALCNACKGTKQHQGKKCEVCNGEGEISKQDVTDDIRLPIPRDKEDAVITQPSGYMSPDLDTLKWMAESQIQFERLIDNTVWGTTKEIDSSGEKTATGEYIDIQPVVNRLNVYSDFAEHIHNSLAYFTIRLIDNQSKQGEFIYKKNYGRRYILEGADSLIEKYNKAKLGGSPYTILDNILNEIISSKYKSDAKMRAEMTKKISVEPYVHLTETEVFTIYGAEESFKKSLFSQWWENEANKKESIINLNKQFEDYVKTRIKTFRSMQPAHSEEGQN